MARTAIVTLIIGEPYRTYWQAYCQPTWHAYAQQHDMDIIALTAAFDTSDLGLMRSPAWQKCLVLSSEIVRKYEQVILLDADIVINAQAAPNITHHVPLDRVGGVISGSHIHEDLRVVMLQRQHGREYVYQPGQSHWTDNQKSYYEPYGLAAVDPGVIQTGVLVASPRYHAELFRSVYAQNYPVESRSFEQIPLSHAILEGDLFQPLDARFNHVLVETMMVHYPFLLQENYSGRDAAARQVLQTQFANSFFLHFAYDRNWVKYLVN